VHLKLTNREVHSALRLSVVLSARPHVSGQLRRLMKMFGERGTHAIVIQVKRDKTFGQIVIPEPSRLEDSTKNLPDRVRRTAPVCQLRPEREAADVLEHDESVFGDVISARRAQPHLVEVGLLIAM